jgi:hypothetical protein
MVVTVFVHRDHRTFRKLRTTREIGRLRKVGDFWRPTTAVVEHSLQPSHDYE